MADKKDAKTEELKDKDLDKVKGGAAGRPGRGGGASQAGKRGPKLNRQ